MRIQWKSHEGEQRDAHRWRKGNSRAVVACIHGMSGSGQQFEPLPENMEGISFYALDLRGQGSDPLETRRGMLLDVENQLRDIDLFLAAVAAEHPGESLFLMGESMGALLAAAYAAEYSTNNKAQVNGLILSVPVVELAKPVPGVLRQIMRLVARAAPKARLSPGIFVKSQSLAPKITRDEAYQKALREKPHHISNFTLRFLVELGDLIEKSQHYASQIGLPTLVLAAGQDCFVRPEQIASWFEKIPEGDKTLHTYAEAYHLLWHDWDKQIVMDDIHQWITDRI